MLRDMLSSKLVRAGLIGCVLLIAGSLLYRRHVVGAIRRDEARTKQFLREFEAKIAAAEKIDTNNAKHPATPTAMKDSLVYPIIKGTLYVKWDETLSPEGYRYIKNSTGHPDDGLRLRTIRWEKRGNLTEADIPPDITLISYGEGSIDPYEFLGLQR